MGPSSGSSDELVDAVIAELKQPPVHAHGDGWGACEAQRAFIDEHIKDGLRLTKIRKLLQRKGRPPPYATLHRFAVQELGFGKKAATVPVVDGAPGEELQVDPGSVGFTEPDEHGKRRLLKVIVFTPNVSRYRFVHVLERETTEEVIAACEAAWAFYGGVFRALIVDNLKAVVQRADLTEPLLNPSFQEYAQARGFVVDTARVRKPQDKARVERAIRDVRDDCFAGERLRDLAAARERALRWSRDEYGARRHGTTGRMPREHFLNVEAPALLPPPSAPSTCRSGSRRRSAAITSCRSSAPSTRCRRGRSAGRCGCASIERSSASTTHGAGSSGSASAWNLASGAPIPPTSPRRNERTRCVTSSFCRSRPTSAALPSAPSPGASSPCRCRGPRCGPSTGSSASPAASATSASIAAARSRSPTTC
ncbi:MAG: transposase [Candidatus Eisenbacteria bacterium]|nr:transposase [Candidatus Eisenbacteria bacterium]